jgi:acetolactate synthase-1/2/3 large subunit
MTGYDALAAGLAAEGVRFLSTFPHQPLIDACAAIGIRPIVCRQERAGVNLADGFTRATFGAKFGVFAMQRGPGAENAFSGVAQAYADSVPLLHLAGGEELSRRGVAPTFEATPVYRYVSKWAAQVHTVADVPAMLRRAVAQLQHGRRAPVVLELPADVMDETYPGDTVDYVAGRQRRSAASAEDVRDLVAALLAAQRPVINAGQGVLYAQATAELIEFAELAHVPVMTTMAGKSAFPETHPLALGPAARTRPLAVERFVAEADFVLGIGTSFTRNGMTMPMPDAAPLGQVTNHAEDVGKDYEVGVGAIGDAKLVLRQLTEEYRRQDGPAKRDGSSVAERIAAAHAEFRAQWEPLLSSAEVPINPYRVIRELQLAFPAAETIITHDSGYPRDQMVPMWQATTPGGYIGWGKSTQLGYGLGLALGAKLAVPDKHVVNVMGDAAFGMAGMDIETAVRCEIPIITVVLNNGVMTYYDSYFPIAAEKYGVNRLTGNYAAVAAALGANAERVDQPADLAAAFTRAKQANREGRPAVVEVMCRAEERIAT